MNLNMLLMFDRSIIGTAKIGNFLYCFDGHYFQKWQKQPPKVFHSLRPATLLKRDSGTGVFL